MVAVGQSNAANYAATRASGGAGVYALQRGQLFHASDPLPGADGERGSIWTRLGAQLAASQQFDAIVLAVAARGSSFARDWAPGGRTFPLLEATLTDLQRTGLAPDFILWHQGESEGLNATASGADYLAAVQAVQSHCQQMFPNSIFVVAQATLYYDAPRNEQIRLAQRTAGALPRAAVGPDLDQLDGDNRSDGVHFSARGATAAAELWFATLRPLIERRREAQVLPSHP
ncbi:sialate O-acetylesterase [Opitutus terrae]|uniref:sialate O-acetylesterase n=1 Tax=Opitutus terrae TaxID=107709 RepID=UPI0002DC0434|nr:sialate O-acetylesterase [Opitutus terrae]